MIKDKPAAKLINHGKYTRGLAVEFRYENDCIAHRIVGTGLDGETVPLLESVEGDFHRSWPKSPMLQALNVDDLRNGDFSIENRQSSAMLIGTTGNGHWSLTIEPYHNEATVGLAFDVACRVRSLPPQLTSSYRISESVKANSSAQSLHMSSRLGEYLLETLPIEDSTDDLSCQLSIEKARLKITRETSMSETSPVTLRWRYWIQAL